MEDKRGCIKTKFIINFRKPDENLVKDTAHLFDNDKIAPNIASISIEFLKNLRPSFISPDLTASLNNVLNEVLFGFSDKDFLQSILSNNLDKMVSLSASEKLSLFDLKFLEAFPNVLSNFAESASLDDILTNNLQSIFNMHDGRKLAKFEAKLTDIFLNKYLNNLDLDGQQNIFHTLGRILNKPLYQT